MDVVQSTSEEYTLTTRDDTNVSKADVAIVKLLPTSIKDNNVVLSRIGIAGDKNLPESEKVCSWPVLGNDLPNTLHEFIDIWMEELKGSQKVL